MGLKNKNDVEIERLRLDPSIFQSAQRDLLIMTELPIWEHFAPAAQLLGSSGHSECQVVEQIRWMSSDWEGLVLGVCSGGL